jgi:carbon monoxide dehydrogenase subunit G
MRRASRDATITAPVAAVFAFLVDPANLPRWMSGVLSAEETSPGPVSIGTKAHIVRQLLGQRIEADLRVTGLEPDHRIVLATETSGVRVEATLEVEPVVPDACRVTFGMSVEATNPFMAPMEPMVASAAEADLGDSLVRLQAAFA